VPLVLLKRPALIALDATPLDGANEDERQSCADRLIQQVISKRFDYHSAPLFDAALMRLTPNHHRLLIVVSHLIADALSLQIVQEDLLAEYASACGLPGAVNRRASPYAPSSYADFADWQRTRVGDVDAFAGIWIPHFTAFERFSLEVGRGAAAGQDPLAAASVEVEFSRGDHVRLAKAAAARRVTPYMMLLAGFALQLRAALRVEDVAVILHFANRRHPQTRRLVGWLANSFPLGLRASSDQTFDDVLEQVREAETTIDTSTFPFLPCHGRYRSCGAHWACQSRKLPRYRHGRACPSKCCRRARCRSMASPCGRAR
jgi:hypothetical protein